MFGGGLGLCGKNRESSQRILRTTLLNQVTMPVIGKLVIETITSFSLARGKEGIYNPLYTCKLR